MKIEGELRRHDGVEATLARLAEQSKERSDSEQYGGHEVDSDDEDRPRESHGDAWGYCRYCEH